MNTDIPALLASIREHRKQLSQLEGKLWWILDANASAQTKAAPGEPPGDLLVIMEVVAAAHGRATHLMRERERTASVALMRQTAMTLSRQFTRHSFAVIADAFNRSIATVHHSMESIENRLITEASFFASYTNISAAVKAGLKSYEASQKIAA